MRIIHLLLTLIALCLSCPTQASPFRGGTFASCPYTMPLPLGSNTAVTAYSFFKLVNGYNNMAANVRRIDNNATADIGFLADGCSPDIAALTSFCSGTTCAVKTWYNQTGGANVTQATNSKQPLINISAINGHSAASCASASSQYLTGTLGVAVGTTTQAMVGTVSIASGLESAFGISSGSRATFLGWSTNCMARKIGTTTTNSTEACTVNTPYAWLGDYNTNNTNNRLLLNGIAGTPDTTANTLTATTTINVCGLNNGSFWNGLVAEAIAFSTNISAADGNMLTNSQRSRYGLP